MSVLARLDAGTRTLLERAWEIRRATRPDEIRFDTVGRTQAVSVTGRACGAKCAHCGGHYLEAMLTPDEARAMVGGRKGRVAPGRAADTPRSWLVSGGCTAKGQVPLLRDPALLEELGRTGPLNLHAGLVRNEAEAAGLARHAAAVSFDFVVDTQTIEDVYGFRGVTGDDFIRSFELLSAHTRVVPHVLVGLAGGKVQGEFRALEELARLGAEGVALLVLIPTRGSRFEGLSPPPLADVARVMAEARLALPGKPVRLGCMRPKGRYRAELDLLAVRASLDRIAVPTPGAVREATSLGLRPVWSEECCVFPSGEGN